MFLKGLKDKFKHKSGSKFLKEELLKPAANVQRSTGITAIGCLVDLDNFEKPELFFEFVDEYNLRPNAVKIIGYKSYYDKNSPYSTPVFSDKDLGWKGEIENSYALEFLSRDYDLLVNYYNEENLLLQLMTVKTKARVKVGFKEVDQRLNDLILEIPIKDFKTFKLELKKYLKVLNEIT
ncbi:DUF6913 domain-containing protein [Maribacter sp. HTCC2170]|uniref:DUF6913 domain-containing protein n=1 Tax=Maribacter sp. (strain HTCC2170 / KCCM 42371) TaxID=313603 RepID=UPI00006B21FA|nr:hypothetical protein [Maribacter sp. HTCC2170]EAR00419.1 hypothetical protein FB2170_13396 [Maribacter sp. HTCC2170]